jgi:hypothetical protein
LMPVRVQLHRVTARFPEHAAHKRAFNLLLRTK